MSPVSLTPSSIELDPLVKEAEQFFEAVQKAQDSGAKSVRVCYRSVNLELGLPPLGEGDRGIVYPLNSHSLDFPAIEGKLCLKVAKPEPVCRERLLEEGMTTSFFLSEGVAVPGIHYMEPSGCFCVKDFIEGESITSIYLRLQKLTIRTQQVILEGLEKFLNRLLDLFRKRPDCKVSISPNNIYVLSEGGKYKDPAQFVLIDPGTTLKKDYSDFDFSKYWNEVLPDRIRKYQKTGYMQWLVPRQVTQSERDEVKEFEIFRNMKPSEVFLILKAAKTVEFDPEEVILQEGAVGGNFYLILEGEVKLRKGGFVTSGFEPRLKQGSVLGEMAFLLHVARSMTAVAATPCKLVEIDQDQFNELLEANLIAPNKLIRNIAVMLAERLHSLDTTHQMLVDTQAEHAKS